MFSGKIVVVLQLCLLASNAQHFTVKTLMQLITTNFHTWPNNDHERVSILGASAVIDKQTDGLCGIYNE